MGFEIHPDSVLIIKRYKHGEFHGNTIEIKKDGKKSITRYEDNEYREKVFPLY